MEETIGDMAPPSGLRSHPRVLTTLMTDDLRQMITESLLCTCAWLAIYDDLPRPANIHKKLCWVAAERKEEWSPTSSNSSAFLCPTPSFSFTVVV